jgi:hypothetical protein
MSDGPVIAVTVEHALLPCVAKAPRKSVADWIVRLLDGTESLRVGPSQPTSEPMARDAPDGVPRPGGRRRRPRRLKTVGTRPEC